MNYQDFEKHFHKFIRERDYAVSLANDRLNEEFESKKREIFNEYHNDMNQKIGDCFKQMSLEDKIKFLNLYVGDRESLKRFMEPEELTALRILK